MTNIKKKIKNVYQWVLDNFSKIIIILVVHIGLTFLLQLPYVNLIRIVISFLPYLIDWILVLIMFKPSKQIILKSAFYLLIVGFFLNLAGLKQLLEIVGLAIYLFLATYILLSLKEIRYKDND